MDPFLIALCGPALFVVVAFALGIITPSYSPVKQTVSELVLGKFGIVQTLNFAISGLLIAILSTLLASKGAALVPVIGVGTMGAILFLSAFYKTDPVEGSIDKPSTPRGMMHVLLFIVGVLAIVLTQAIFAAMMFGSIVSLYACASALVIIACLLLVLRNPRHQGVYQRILIVTIMLWITVFAVLYKN